MPTRDDVAKLRDHLGMYLPVRSYSAVVGFLTGAQWADSKFLRDFQTFVSVDLTGSVSLVWSAALAFHVLGEESGTRVLRGEGSVEENESAIETLFETIARYFDCVDAGVLEEKIGSYTHVRNPGNESNS